jgi:hypothetical protein
VGGAWRSEPITQSPRPRRGVDLNAPSCTRRRDGRPARLHHLRDDTLDWGSPAKLGEVVQFAAGVVDALSERHPAWTRGSLP